MGVDIKNNVFNFKIICHIINISAVKGLNIDMIYKKQTKILPDSDLNLFQLQTPDSQNLELLLIYYETSPTTQDVSYLKRQAGKQ